MRRIVEAEMIKRSERKDRLPEPSLPEAAFVGRSNSGKSSLLNALCNRKNLFKVSQTPGRTRLITHVEARFDTGASIYLADLPGYGYAKVAKAARRSWEEALLDYLQNRETLHLVVLTIDVRRGLQDEETELLDLLSESGIPAIIAATKTDKVSKTERESALAKLSKIAGVRAVGTSVKTRDGIDLLLSAIAKGCGYE